MPQQACIISCSFPSKEAARAAAQALLAAKLIACGQIREIESHYNWQGKTEQSSEWLLELKTLENLYPQIEAKLKDLHSYDCPEILATALLTGSKDYLQWLEEQCSG